MSKFNWNMVGAIGEWFGALATFAAVVVALRQGRTRIIVNSDIRMKARDTTRKNNVVTVRIANLNDGYIQINEVGITQIGVLSVSYGKENFPKILVPGEVFTCEISILDRESWGVMKAYAIDGFGKVHNQKMRFKHKVINSVILNHPEIFK